MTSTERFAYEQEIKSLKARNEYLAKACEGYMQKERINGELIESLRSANHSLQEKLNYLESHQ